jgi:hypothetical protein
VEASPERPAPAPRVQPLLLALSLLTLVAGLVDAACDLGLGRVFTANMTGNVALLAFGAAGALGLPVLAPPCRWWGCWSARPPVGGWPGVWSGRPAPGAGVAAAPLVMLALRLELLVVAVAGVAAVGLPVDAGGVRRYVVIGLLAAGLGSQTRPCVTWRFPMSPRPR